MGGFYNDAYSSSIHTIGVCTFIGYQVIIGFNFFAVVQRFSDLMTTCLLFSEPDNYDIAFNYPVRNSDVWWGVIYLRSHVMLLLLFSILINEGASKYVSVIVYS